MDILVTVLIFTIGLPLMALAAVAPACLLVWWLEEASIERAVRKRLEEIHE